MRIKYGPREKIEEKGIKALSDDELLAILLKTGSREENVLELSKRILDEVSSLKNLNDYTFEELMCFKGIGKAKAMVIISALELGNRIRKKDSSIKHIKKPSDIYLFVRNDYLSYESEKAICLYLNPSCEILSKQILSVGSFDRVNIEYKEIVKRALKLNASSICLIHNHPSGMAKSSINDEKTLISLEKFLTPFGIEIFDSIIITDSYYYSMKFGFSKSVKEFN